MSTSGAETLAVVLTGAVLTVATVGGQQAPADPDQGDSFRFRSGVELINVTATVTDARGRFVPDLQKEDFLVYEDDELQTVTHFNAERVPVSLGIVLDTSGSMAGDKIRAAQRALDRFLYDLLDRQDEMFLYRFSDDAILLQGWTNDPALVSRAIGRVAPSGGTAMYDAVAEAIPMAQDGNHRKKALIIISDGNDTLSRVGVREVKRRARESEVLIYAIGIDGDSDQGVRRRPLPPTRLPLPFPPLGRGRPGWPSPQPPIGGPTRQGGGWGAASDDRVNVVALREMTDDSGGRTEIVRDVGDLNPATANIASELNRQYYLGYAASGKKDGRWHSIRVEVRKGSYRVRARRGYVAS
jgi:Ca-activated chloride channel family protein